jgi:mannitol/fructose-specific phosphotransferase system IIA component
MNLPMLKMENIFLNQPKAEREDIIRRCGRILVDSGYAQERYIEGMLKRDNSFSTAIGNHIAIPHGEKEYKDAILSTGLAVLCYPQGIEWHDSIVHLVIAIAAKGDEHIDIIGNVVDKLDTGEDVIKLVERGDQKAVYNMLCGKEE